MRCLTPLLSAALLFLLAVVTVPYGWNIYSLYDGQPFPGLAEAFQRRDLPAAERELARITAGVARLVDGLAEAAALADARR